MQRLQSHCTVYQALVHCDLEQRISELDVFQKSPFVSNTTHEPWTCVDFQIHGHP